MTKKEAIENIQSLDKSYLNSNQKNLAIEIINSFQNENQIDSLLSFILQRVKTGFTFDETFEVAKGWIAIAEEKKDLNINIEDDTKVDFENKLFIGENYDVLKNLLLTHKQSIDIIYIDPPYNTESASKEGNTSYKNSSNNENSKTSSKFIYNDKFGRTGWLNLLKQRLVMAKELLKENGLIFISIDDHEQAYLKVMMDEIFGEENFVNNLIWIKKISPSGSTTNEKHQINTNHEYILCYAKNLEKCTFNYIKYSEEELNKLYKLKDEYFEERGYYKKTPLYRHSSSSNFKYQETLDYPITAPDGSEFKLHLNEVLPQNACYTWSKDTFDIGNSLGFIVIEKNIDNKWEAFRKQYQKVTFESKSKQVLPYEPGKDYGTLIDYNNLRTSKGKKNIKDIFDDKNVFTYPKPTELIKHIINLHPNPNAIVLDFFAGSGTTGNAVLELNREDGGNRQFILATNNENNIGYNVNYERLFRIINGKGTRGETFDWLIKHQPFVGTMLRVFEINNYNIAIGDKNNVSLEVLKDKASKNLRLINSEYQKEDLELFYDLSSLNPLEVQELPTSSLNKGDQNEVN